MRLLNTHSLELDEFFDNAVPKYAILSHTWEKEEVVFADIQNPDKARAKAGFAKIQGACALAASHGYDYVWIDTCCIDKSSSAELSEAINSMWAWYRDAAVCYAYLCDVDGLDGFGRSRWFTRGWTLQELIAPARVEFYSGGWQYLGEKQDDGLISAVFQASRVDECVLAGVVRHTEVSVARRMYWASNRVTTRKEDEAYCLMGLFDVNMPLLYGEREKAFIRLQREIAKSNNDQSILAWYCGWDDGDTSELDKTLGCYAPSPRCFAMSGDISLFPLRSRLVSLPSSQLDGSESEFSAILVGEGDLEPEDGEILVLLYCQVGCVPGTFAALRLRQVTLREETYYYRFAWQGAVDQLSVHDSGFLVAHDDSDQSLGLMHDNGTIRALPRSDGRTQRFWVTSLGVAYTEIYKARTSDSLADFHRRTQLWALKSFDHAFWLVPLQLDPSRVSVTISAVCPAMYWDRTAQRFLGIRSKTFWENRESFGAAFIDVTAFKQDSMDADVVHRTLRRAVVVFGTSPATEELRCCLFKHDGVSDLASYLNRDVGQQLGLSDECTWSSPQFTLTLKASVVLARVNYTYLTLIKLWATSSQGPADDTGLGIEADTAANCECSRTGPVNGN